MAAAGGFAGRDADEAVVVATTGEVSCESQSRKLPWVGARDLHLLTAGRWYFEVLAAKGLVRVGVATRGQGNREIGTDTFSMGYGGTGKRSFNQVFIPYGCGFKEGDVVGATVDVDAKKVEWSVNGVGQGPVDLPDSLLASGNLVPAVCGKRPFKAIVNIGPAFAFPVDAQPVSAATQAPVLEEEEPWKDHANENEDHEEDDGGAEPTVITADDGYSTCDTHAAILFQLKSTSKKKRYTTKGLGREVAKAVGASRFAVVARPKVTDTRVLISMPEVTKEDLVKLVKLDYTDTMTILVTYFAAESIEQVYDIASHPGGVEAWHTAAKLACMTSGKPPSAKPKFRVTLRGNRLNARKLAEQIATTLGWDPELRDFDLHVHAIELDKAHWMLGFYVRQEEKVVASQSVSAEKIAEQQQRKELLKMATHDAHHFIDSAKQILHMRMRDGSKQKPCCRRVERTVVSQSTGGVFTMCDMAPMFNMDDVVYQDEFIWEFLPRGYCEVWKERCDGRELKRLLFGMRKFGNEVETFGVLKAPPEQTVADIAQQDPETVLGFMTKENGEMFILSFFDDHTHRYAVFGSKNVRMLACIDSAEMFERDINAMVYSGQRYDFSRSMGRTLGKVLFEHMSADQRASFSGYSVKEEATYLGESIDPENQHITDYLSDGLTNRLLFFAITTHRKSSEGITLMGPRGTIDFFTRHGLETAKELVEVKATDEVGVKKAEEYFRTLENSEGSVVYVQSQGRVLYMYKWKNEWYTLVRALREKIASCASWGAVKKRVAALHVHHPDEERIVAEFRGFYSWLLRHVMPVEWGTVRNRFVELQKMYRESAEAEVGKTAPDLPTVDVQLQILMRGLQGSGKTSTCVALRHLYDGKWFNQDEEVGMLQSGTGNKKGIVNSIARLQFLEKLQDSSGDPTIPALLIDKINIKSHHIKDILESLAKGVDGKKEMGCKTEQLLVSFVHPEDTEGEMLKAKALCLERINGRGKGHRTLFPEAAQKVLNDCAADMEPVHESSPLHSKAIAVDMTKTNAEVVKEILTAVRDRGLPLPCGRFPDDAAIAEAVKKAAEHEAFLRNVPTRHYWSVAINLQDYHALLREVAAAVGDMGKVEMPTGDSFPVAIHLKQKAAAPAPQVQVEKKEKRAREAEEAVEDPEEALNIFDALDDIGVEVSEEMADLAAECAEEEEKNREPKEETTDTAQGSEPPPADDKTIQLEPTKEPHVTLMYPSPGTDVEGFDKLLLPLDGAECKVTVSELVWDIRVAAVRVEVHLATDGSSLPVQNKHPHITMAKSQQAEMAESNDVLQRAAEGGGWHHKAPLAMELRGTVKMIPLH